MHFAVVFAILSLSAAGGQMAPDAKADCEILMNEAIPFAKRMLREHGEFYPYGYVMKPSGEIALKAGYDGTEHPKSQVIIDLLTAGFKEDAAAGRVKATALVYDIRVIPPGASEKSDAIAIALDHRDNYSVVVILPYVLNHGEISVGTAFAQRRDSHVFAPRASN
jgi:hypothetical protein